MKFHFGNMSFSAFSVEIKSRFSLACDMWLTKLTKMSIRVASAPTLWPILFVTWSNPLIEIVLTTTALIWRSQCPKSRVNIISKQNQFLLSLSPYQTTVVMQNTRRRSAASRVLAPDWEEETREMMMVWLTRKQISGNWPFLCIHQPWESSSLFSHLVLVSSSLWASPHWMRSGQNQVHSCCALSSATMRGLQRFSCINLSFLITLFQNPFFLAIKSVPFSWMPTGILW